MNKRIITYMFSIVITALIVVPNIRGSMPEPATPVWIDTDPACGLSATDDVDDCWALLAAIKSNEIVVRGISTVFGNVDSDTAHRVATDLIQRIEIEEEISSPVIFKGASDTFSPGNPQESDASWALATALKRENLTIIALGPLTNIAATLELNPDLVSRVETIIAIAGNRPGERRFWFQRKMLHFHDLNFKKDPLAFGTILSSGIPLTLLPFEAAQHVSFTAEDLDQISNDAGTMEWLADASRGWLRFWEKSLGENGFYPFDSLAVGFVVMPELFTCGPIPAQVVKRSGRFVNRDELAVSRTFTEGAIVNYCTAVDSKFKEQLFFHQHVSDMEKEIKNDH